MAATVELAPALSTSLPPTAEQEAVGEPVAEQEAPGEPVAELPDTAWVQLTAENGVEYSEGTQFSKHDTLGEWALVRPGFIRSEIGQEVTVLGPDGEPVVTFTLTDIQVHATCPDPAGHPPSWGTTSSWQST